jgi:hypothetical protein
MITVAPRAQLQLQAGLSPGLNLSKYQDESHSGMSGSLFIVSNWALPFRTKGAALSPNAVERHQDKLN